MLSKNGLFDEPKDEEQSCWKIIFRRIRELRYSDRIGLAQWRREIRRRSTKVVRIRGTIIVSEPFVMAGQLDGDVNADTLHSRLTAIVTGKITAQSVPIDGRFLRAIVADKVFFRQRRILKVSCIVRTLPLMMTRMLTQNLPRSR